MTAISLVTDTILSPIGAYIAIVSMYSLFCILSILHRLRSRVTAENFLCGPKPVRFPSSSFIDMIDFFCSIDIFFHFMRNNSHIWSQTLYVYVWSKNSILSFAGRDKCPSCRWLRRPWLRFSREDFTRPQCLDSCTIPLLSVLIRTIFLPWTRNVLISW